MFVTCESFAISGHKLAKFLFLYYQPYSRSVLIKIAHMLSSVRQAVAVIPKSLFAFALLAVLRPLLVVLCQLCFKLRIPPKMREIQVAAFNRMQVCSKLISNGPFCAKIG